MYLQYLAKIIPETIGSISGWKTVNNLSLLDLFISTDSQKNESKDEKRQIQIKINEYKS